MNQALPTVTESLKAVCLINNLREYAIAMEQQVTQIQDVNWTDNSYGRSKGFGVGWV
jgi:hypothetical protein